MQPVRDEPPLARDQQQVAACTLTVNVPAFL
jgi:hypothetical protein